MYVWCAQIEKSEHCENPPDQGLKKKLDASRPSEQPAIRGKMLFCVTGSRRGLRVE